MNILFLTLVDFFSYNERNIYTDLLQEFMNHGHNVYSISPVERRTGKKTAMIHEGLGKILKLQIGNIQKTNVVEKGISTLLIEPQAMAAIKKYFANVKFDLVIYSTPPITFVKAIAYIKNRDGAKSYLLLKDIFPQNAVDLGMFSKNSLIYRLFSIKEKKLYTISDYIGCMSQANVDYILRNNPTISPAIVHISPNTIQIDRKPKNTGFLEEIRKKYGIPSNCTVFVYGGNLGKPQSIPFVIDCLKANQDKKDRFFVICGAGTEYHKLKDYVEKCKPHNTILINGLSQGDYEDFIQSCDVGLIFLDHRFTIPNFPSRLLTYLQHRMPVLACTDLNTDLGQIITEEGFGWWCESNSVEDFTQAVDKACNTDLLKLGERGFNYLAEHYTVNQSYQIIMEKLK